MRKIEIKKFIKNKEDYQSMTINQIKSELNKLKIEQIELKDKKLIKAEDKEVTIRYTSCDNPFIVKKNTSNVNSLFPIK